MATNPSSTWAPVPLPYFSETVAAAVRSAEEVRSCSDIIYERLAAKIVALSDQVVAKFGHGVHEREGQTLIYLERYVPEVPAPRLYAMYNDNNQTFLLMQRMPGVRLDRIWDSLSTREKENISLQLHQSFESLRKAECPWPNFFGGVAGDGVHHHLLHTQDGSHKYLGPFSSEAEFASCITQNFRTRLETNGHPVHKALLYEAHLGEVLRNHRSTLTHGDVHGRNIVVAETTGCRPIDEERQFSVALVDWERAGWLPEFWEHFCAHMACYVMSIDDDWRCYTERFLPVWLAEAAAMRLLDVEMIM